MDENELQEAIERNSDIIMITMFVITDLLITSYILDYAITIQAKPNFTVLQSGFQYDPIRFVIHRQTFNMLLIFKSLILYMGAFGIAKRLPQP